MGKLLASSLSSSSSERIRRWSNAAMALFFAYATYVQMNDPDASFWMAFYGLASLACAMTAICNRVALVRGVFSAVALIAASNLIMQWLVTDQFAFDPKTEPGREASGTMIVLGWALQNLIVTAPSPMVATSIMVAALTLVASIYTIPAFYLTTDDTIEHCIGLGFRAGSP